MKPIPPHGNCPSWLEPATPGVDNTGYDIIEEKADIIRRIYQLSADGWAAGQIADLFTNKVPTIGRRNRADTGKPVDTWDERTINFWLNSMAPIGFMDGDEPREAVYPPIIDDDLYDAVCKQLGKNSSGPKTGSNLLQGLLVCSCGETVKFRGGPNPYIECQTKKKCLKRIPYLPLQTLVFDAIAKYMPVPELLPENAERQKELRLEVARWIQQEVESIVLSAGTVTITYHNSPAETLSIIDQSPS